MKPSKKTCSMILLALLFVAGQDIGWAANRVELNLDDAVHMAMENNRSIKKSVADVDSAYWQLRENRRNCGPTLSWSATGNRVGGKSYEQSGYTRAFTNSVSLSIPLYTGDKLEQNIKSAQSSLDAANLSLEAEKQTIRNTVTSDYFTILKYRSQIEVDQDSVANLQAHLDNVNAQFRAGTIAKADILSSEVSLADKQQSLVTAQNNYQVAIATLNNDIGLETGTETIIKDDLKYTPYQLNLSECEQYALNYRPDILQKSYEAKEYDAAKESAKSGGRPQVTASANRSFGGDNPFGTNHNSSDYWSVGVSASWDVFDNGVTKAQVLQKEAKVNKAKEAYEAQKESAMLEVRTAYLDLIAAEKNIHTSQMSVGKAQEDYRIEQEKYSAGVGTNLDVLDAEKKLSSAKGDYVTALYTYNASKTALDKAMGIPVDLDVSTYASRPRENSKQDKDNDQYR